ncbi:MAG: recombinase RecA [Chloroflexi bacterium]|nr:recombinase RecA [Chloroflexota bacterium]
MTNTDKTDKTDKIRREALETALAQIEKDHGKGAVMRLGEIYDSLTTECIPTGSLALDIALGIGGIPRGRVTEIFGAESAGKSTLAIHIMAETQKLGGIAAYIDVEHALDPTYAGSCGLILDDLLIAQPDSAEQALDITEQLVRSGAVDAVVIDSVAALVPQAEIEGDMGDTHVGLQARLMSQALRKLTSTIHRSRTAVIFINQLREKIGVTYGSPEVTPGGRALKFYSSVRIDLRRVESIKQGAEVIGNRVRARVVKNKVAAPFRVAEFDIMFNLGISKVGDILEIGVEQGIIKKSGAFYSYGDTKLGQGRENSKDFLTQHPEIAASVEGRLRSPATEPAPDGKVSSSEAEANGGSPHAKDTVADILSGTATQEPDDKE